MTVTASKMVSLGKSAPDFSLPDTEGNIVSLSDFEQAPALLVVFMCNHCPFVKHILNDFVELAKEYQQKGLAVVAINSNDVESFPEDNPEMMAQKAKETGFTFPYLYDETQEIAKAYQATCTPDFFLYDKERKLVYRGQMDDSRPGNNVPITGSDLRSALEAVLEGKKAPAKQRPSMGCNIKWKEGNEPDYYTK
ncbi:MAG: alkyl hydroperoxide reductase [Planctomycetes bacterium RBG_13_44_8b]|nr:MAG: alkyl hydroperoxide reductase [Planctomycetes bacterium RBG_13_44_8b]